MRTRLRPRPRAGRRELSAEELTMAWQSASLLLDYPGDDQDLDVVRRAVPHLPVRIAEPLTRFLAHRDATELRVLQQDYVETFDSRRRCNLFLTYFAHGDTRKRGMALLRFKQAYLAAGVELDDSELPDHLCVVLEFAACVDQAQGRQLMLDHRAGLELLRIALTDLGSPWSDVMEAVSATLPPLEGEEREAVRRLAAEGPPEEEVGLTPYGTPQFDAALSDMGGQMGGRRMAPPTGGGVVDLPMPSLPTTRRGA